MKYNSFKELADAFNEGEKPKSGFRKIAEPPEEKCRHQGHNPPQHIYLQPGTYEYTCPSCGATKIINVPKITC